MGLSSGEAEGVAVGVWLHSGNLNRGFWPGPEGPGTRSEPEVGLLRASSCPWRVLPGAAGIGQLPDGSGSDAASEPSRVSTLPYSREASVAWLLYCQPFWLPHSHSFIHSFSKHPSVDMNAGSTALNKMSSVQLWILPLCGEKWRNQSLSSRKGPSREECRERGLRLGGEGMGP